MMPGDSQSKMVAIAADATVGNCQNCSVLHQSLNEYLSSFLALKQKITVSDDTIRLQQQLEELEIKLVTLEKKTSDYESLQAELEDKKGALEAYGQMSEEMEKLKQENISTLTENKKLEGQLMDAKDLTEKQSLENAQLKREKAVVENDLLEAQTSLMKSQAKVAQIEKLMEENAKTTRLKETLENKVALLKDQICKQNHQMSQLTKEKILLERNIDDLQARVTKLERERNKDFISTSTQASVPEEHKVDKEKFRMLLKNLWACVEPQQDTTNLLPLPASSSKQVVPCSPSKRLQSHLRNASMSSPHKISESLSHPVQPEATSTQIKPSPDGQKTNTHRACLQSTYTKKKAETPKKIRSLSEEAKTKESSTDRGCSEVPLEEIFAMFGPLPPCLSPLQDLATEMETMETNAEEKNEHLPLQQVNPVLITSSVPDHSANCSALRTKEKVDLAVVATKEAEPISNENDSSVLEKNEPRDMEDEKSPDVEEVQLEEMQIEQLICESTSCASSTSDITVSAEVVSLNIESQKPCCSEIPKSDGEIENAKEDPSETTTKMQVDTNQGDVTSAITTTPCQVSPRSSDTAVISEKAPDVKHVTSCITSSTFIEKQTEVITPVQSSELVGEHLDSCGLGESHEDTTVLKPKETKPCLTEDTFEGIFTVSNQNVEEKLENDTPIQLSQEEAGTEAQAENEEASTSHGDDRPKSPSMSLMARTEIEESHPIQEIGQANVKTPSKKDDNVETSESAKQAGHTHPSSGSPETNTFKCDSLKENIHSICRSLSPLCLYPIVNLRTLENLPNLEKSDGNLNIEHISTSGKSPPPMPETEKDCVSQQANAKELPEDNASSRRVRKCRLRTVSPTVPLKKSSAARNGHLESEGESSAGAASTAAKPPEFLGKVRCEMGPPLPPVLTPLITPPKEGKSINPRQAIGKLLFPSPMERLASPTTPVKTLLTPNSPQQSSSSLNSPLRTNGVPSSPLQFGSATPKHAVPVPGRLPRTAANSSSPSSSSPSQENSMRILDTMYPELSAHARTLSILRGNVGLSMCSSESRTSPSTTVTRMSGFKTVNSVSTAFTKTETRGGKRQANNLPEAKNRKCLRLDNCSPVSRTQLQLSSSNSREESASPQALTFTQPQNDANSQPMEGKPTQENSIDSLLRKIENQCFDLLPVIQSHLYVGNMPQKPVLRDEEKEVIAEICKSGSPKADEMISAIQCKLKADKRNLSPNYMQALCRVYTAICRQRSDWDKAHILAYSILIEDFPDAAKLILFIVTTWPGVLSHSSSLCQAIHAVTKVKAQENLLRCLSAFLGWEKIPPGNIDELISRTMSDIRSGSNLSFTKNSRHGEDLGPEAWECVFVLQLLCMQKGWKWTYENVLGKELWPLMNTWVTQPSDQPTTVSDVTVATVLHLIGRIGHLGIRAGSISSVTTIANVINKFVCHLYSEDVPWEVQLAAIYCLYELSPINPKQALEALAEWRGEMTQSAPPAITSCINQLASICRQIKS